ncbi:hypothetical protein F5Y11DRAFT_193867 [Daldinia sp. FL1419]|nr:hypothetical protein F5Y11DRAFT_193867 [Daldinia sp. FL1419]
MRQSKSVTFYRHCDVRNRRTLSKLVSTPTYKFRRMQPRKYPPILPSVPLPEEVEPPKPGGLRRQRPGACTSCRHRKIKCDGVRPKCTNCVKREVIFCVYLDKAKAGPEAMEVLELLQSLPMDQAFVLLNSLREKGDPAAVLSVLREGNAEGKSILGTETYGTSPPRNMLELELMANNSKSYAPLRRINASSLAKSDLLRPIRRSVQSNTVDSSTPIDTDLEGRRFHLPVSPGQGIDYCDERLRGLEVDFWTNVMVTNDFTARAISLYIKTDHPLLGLFSPHLFITDLVNRQNRFCSRFLFHALMYLCCQMYSAIDKDAMQFADQFFDEAEKLWKEEQDSYPAVAGAVLLSLSFIGNSRDHAVLFYAKGAMQMGENLGLFDGTEDAVKSNEKLPEDEATTRSYAAWGAFNWNVLMSLFYRQPGVESPSSAPVLPIPGERTSLQRGGSTYESIPADEGLLEMIFPALCNFWQIIQGAAWIYTPAQGRPPGNFQIALVEHTFRELLAWAEALPLPLLRADERPHHVIVLHIWLHCAILDIFRPFIGKPVDQRPRLTTFSAWESSPDMAYGASVAQLKNLIVEYRSKFVASTYSILWHTGLLYLANAVLKDTSDPDRRLYLLLCIYGYEILSRPFRISEVIVQGLLSMTLKETDMSGSEAQGIINELKERRLEDMKQYFEHKIRATFMVDLDLALKDPEEARAENLAAEFDNLALFRDFLEQERMEILS